MIVILSTCDKSAAALTADVEGLAWAKENAIALVSCGIETDVSRERGSFVLYACIRMLTNALPCIHRDCAFLEIFSGRGCTAAFVQHSGVRAMTFDKEDMPVHQDVTSLVLGV